MKKFVTPALIMLTLVLAVLAYFVWHSTPMALLFAGAGVVLWAVTPSGLGDVPPSGSRPDPKAVKEYRKNHTGATISDGIRATREQSE